MLSALGALRAYSPRPLSAAINLLLAAVPQRTHSLIGAGYLRSLAAATASLRRLLRPQLSRRCLTVWPRGVSRPWDQPHESP